ncbi:hypothetical protein YC2023_070635 [Brassica napus]
MNSWTRGALFTVRKKEINGAAKSVSCFLVVLLDSLQLGYNCRESAPLKKIFIVLSIS